MYPVTESGEKIISKKVMTFLIVFNVILLVIAAFIIIDKKIKSSTIRISVTPEIAKIQLNGKEYNQGDHDLIPGEYNLEIVADGFVASTKIITINAGETYTLNEYLLQPNEDYSYYYNHRADYAKLVEYVAKDDKKTNDFIAKVNSIQAIKNQLPISDWRYDNPESNHATSMYRIIDGDSDHDCESVSCILVSWYYGMPDASAIEEKIVSAGYTPSDYQIIYREAK